MSDPAVTTVWARAVADELARIGVREVVVAPGSRSTPLVLAFARDARFRMRVHLDERSAAFFALGVGKALGEPAAIVTTSGTAVANVLPAVVEASQSGVPLMVLTADRPHRLRDSDANQAIDQVRIYGGFVRAFFDIAPPSSDEAALRHLRAVVGRAHAASVGADAGPVHLNFPFDKPLEPVEVDAGPESVESGATGRLDGSPWIDVRAGSSTLSAERLGELAGLLRTERGVIVAGPNERAASVGAAVLRLASVTGFPVLADPLSGARYAHKNGAHAVAAYDLFLKSAAVRARLSPDVIVRVGTSPTSAALQSWMTEHHQATHLVVDSSGRWKDHGTTATHYVQADPVVTLDALSERHETGTGQDGSAGDWTALWSDVEEAALTALEGTEDEMPHEGDILSMALGVLPSGGALVVSSSMPVRDLDGYGHPRDEPTNIFANRGASGIDGVVSTAFGVASQQEGPTVCVIGDVAFFHDQNGLLWSREEDASVVFVLIDNDGGGIFHRLPISGHEPHFTRFFATPHGIDFEHVAQAQGIRFSDVEIGDTGAALRRALSHGHSAVLRVRTDREANHRRHLEVEDAVARSVSDVLG
jgi:2-succinyl-5-enolpyruvyl-6-hydroxy-3-cyclohexene-1-carboxylate synthase